MSEIKRPELDAELLEELFHDQLKHVEAYGLAMQRYGMLLAAEFVANRIDDEEYCCMTISDAIRVEADKLK
jgi:hypothetical protein